MLLQKKVTETLQRYEWMIHSTVMLSYRFQANRILLEFSHEELYKFFLHLEKIQEQMDQLVA
jgi:hypothetical protein